MKKLILISILLALLTNYTLTAQSNQVSQQNNPEKIEATQPNQPDNSPNSSTFERNYQGFGQLNKNQYNPNCDGTQKRIQQNLHKQDRQCLGRKFTNRGRK